MAKMAEEQVFRRRGAPPESDKADVTPHHHRLSQTSGMIPSLCSEAETILRSTHRATEEVKAVSSIFVSLVRGGRYSADSLIEAASPTPRKTWC